MKINMYLQLLADGGDGGDGGAAAASTGDNTSADPGQTRLLELGVPANKIRQRARKAAPAKAEPAEAETAKAQTPPAEDTPEEATPEAPKAKTYTEEEVQGMIRNRIKNLKSVESSLAALTPGIEVLARHYNLDPKSEGFHQQLSAALENDDRYYEDAALERGEDVEEIKAADIKARADERARIEQERTLEQQKLADHFDRLERESEALKKVFPGFNLQAELKNDTFARLVSPYLNMPVEDAYYAVHRREIDAARSQVIAQTTATQLANSIRAGMSRPVEAGTSTQAPSSIGYHNMNKAAREDLKKEIYASRYTGKKIYPGMR